MKNTSVITELPLPKVGFYQNGVDLTRHRFDDKLLTQSASYELGKSRRKITPLNNLAKVNARPSQVKALQLYDWSNQGRLESLLPVRAKRMSLSPFAYYRGMPSLMLYDQAWQSEQFGNSRLLQQICGDCHLNNFGGYASPERNLLFGLNDFDETIVAPFEWDVKRLVTSIMVALPTMNLAETDGLQAIEKFLKSYCDELESHRQLSPVEVWYRKMDASHLLENTDDSTLKKQWEKTFKKATLNVATKILPKITDKDEKTGLREFKDEPPLQFHPKKSQPFAKDATTFFQEYRDSLKFDRQVLFDRYQLSDVSLKVVGVGSVGIVAAVALFEDADHEPLILQMKQAKPSILSPLFNQKNYPMPIHQGERVVHGQQLMQAASDIFLGYSRLKQPEPQDYYVRQLRDMKYTADLDNMNTYGLFDYVEHCGKALAHAHAKAGNADSLMGYIGKVEDIISIFQQYAVDAAHQNTLDYQDFMAQIDAGKIKIADDDVL